MAKRKVLQQLSLSPDIRDELKRQADEAGFTVSGYVERIVLERKVARETLDRVSMKKPKNFSPKGGTRDEG